MIICGIFYKNKLHNMKINEEGKKCKVKAIHSNQI
jgi:hypothetical protein